MAEKEQVRPLAQATANHPHSDQDYPSSDRVLPIDEEAPTSKWPSSKKLHKKRWILCCGCCTAIVVILSIVVLVLVLTVFQIKDPDMTLNSVKIDGMSSLPASLNVTLTLTAGISIKNPNVASFKFGNGTTVISYQDRTIGEGSIPAGKAPARRTIRMNVTVDVLPSKLLAGPNITRDPLPLSGNITVNSYAKMGGRVNLLNIFKKHADVIMNCTVTMSVSNQTILEQNCKRKVKM